MREARPHYSQAIEWRAPFWIDYGRGNEAQEQKTVGWFSMTAIHYLSLISTEYPNAREGSINTILKQFASYPRVVNKAAIASIISVVPGHGKIDACKPVREVTQKWLTG